MQICMTNLSGGTGGNGGKLAASRMENQYIWEVKESRSLSGETPPESPVPPVEGSPAACSRARPSAIFGRDGRFREQFRRLTRGEM
jgi:hypothetical protein